ncbi:CRISPR-associated endonuclease Cas2 [Candidatus Gottesmanbacteria bacterium]|nr:CRISPR-associated endonuclease Cas2 [Candidatus Gottesmanbacteria bacterium]
MKTRQAKRIALDVTEAVFSRTLDMTLWSVAYLTVLPFTYSMHEPQWKAQVEADSLLSAVNYDRIKRAIVSARHRGLVKKSKRHAWPQMTEAGKKRLASVVPVYEAKRPWDERLHLVTYDIPETQSDDRRLLRDFLRQIGCGRLQDSVWLTPYNPVDLLRTFVDERNLQSSLIVSDMGKDGAIGEEKISDLIVRVYELEKINQQYEEWIANVERQGNPDHWLLLSYLSILKDDPQLPFVLLPKWWKGDHAYRLIEKDMEKVSKLFRSEK